MSNLNIADRSVDVLRHETVYRGFFSVDEVDLRYEKPDGSMSPLVTRTCVERGDAVAILVWIPSSDQILLVRQFRYPTARHGEPWLAEVVAGKIDDGENASQAARRELEEETGIANANLSYITDFYGSPGGMSEMVSIFFAEVETAPTAILGGLPDEDLEILLIPATEIRTLLFAGKIRDGKTQVALHWFFSTRRQDSSS